MFIYGFNAPVKELWPEWNGPTSVKHHCNHITFPIPALGFNSFLCVRLHVMLQENLAGHITELGVPLKGARSSAKAIKNISDRT